ncbi:MAG: AMP-binding protein [Alphaproteobacteria bacterium]|nr:AMP-binding protein [Alphaproteobacteria bacterium]
MEPTAIEISRLLVVPRDSTLTVATGVGESHDWGGFARDVGGLAARLKQSGGRCWLIADRDAYALAVGVFAALHAGCRAVLPANLQQGHIADLAATVDGVISSADRHATNPFDKLPSGDVPGLSVLDAGRAEIVLHTSGTTGAPVAVRKPLWCLEAEIAALTERFMPRAGNTVVATVPPYHIYGLLFRVLWPLATERPFASNLISYPEELHAAAEKDNGCMLVSSPAFLRRALPVLDLNRLKESLGPVFSSGGPLPPSVAAAYNAMLTESVVEVYGSTETGGIACRSVMDAETLEPWRPLPGVEIAVDAQQSVLMVRSQFLPDKDWLVTSDRASLTPDGCFILNGRADRVVKLEEQRVSLSEIERRLADCPTVETARVVQLPDEMTKRQSLAAVIEPSDLGWDTLKQEGRRTLREQLLDALRPYLAAIVLPRKWRFVTGLPEDERGKTSDAALAALFDENLGRRIDPVIVKRKAEADSLTLDLHLPEDLFYFAGHFPEAPILAGVVQIDWAIAFAMTHFAIPEGFRRIEALKFFKILQAGDDVTLALRYDRKKANLTFLYSASETKFSSGRVAFEAAS